MNLTNNTRLGVRRVLSENYPQIIDLQTKQKGYASTILR